MPRDLRPRRTRQSYTNIFHSEDEGDKEPGPSQQRKDDNGSNFTPPVAHEEAARSDKDGGSDDGIGDPSSSIGNTLGTGVDPGSGMKTPHSKKKSGGGASQGKAAKTKNAKAKGKQKASSQVVAPSPAPTPATPQSTTVTALPPTPTPTPQTAPFYATAASARQNYALPNPNIHHRHRPVPLFEGPTASATALKAASATVRVERLQCPPRLFAPNETVPTNAYASAALITRRVGKAWSASVGAGPVWQIVEDLGWFRESEGFLNRGAAQESGQGRGQGQGQGIVCDERARRPRVHDDVALREGWTVFRRAECVSSPLFFHFLSFPFPADLFRVGFLAFFIDSVLCSFRDAVAYMPTDLGGGGSVSGPDVPAAPAAAAAAAPPVSCDFGPFGEQMRVDLKTLDTQRLCKLSRHLTALVQSPQEHPGTDSMLLVS